MFRCRYLLSIAKFCVLAFYLLMEMAVFLAVFVVAGTVATRTMGVTETLPVLYLMKWCAQVCDPGGNHQQRGNKDQRYDL